jgi:hypothetical protein
MGHSHRYRLVPHQHSLLPSHRLSAPRCPLESLPQCLLEILLHNCPQEILGLAPLAPWPLPDHSLPQARLNHLCHLAIAVPFMAWMDLLFSNSQVMMPLLLCLLEISRPYLLLRRQFPRDLDPLPHNHHYRSAALPPWNRLEVPQACHHAVLLQITLQAAHRHSLTEVLHRMLVTPLPACPTVDIPLQPHLLPWLLPQRSHQVSCSRPQ